ncbi:PITH domain [Geosmithia morbida]|uniref:PITH domain n=1 Tax=Geosmithia morbida TaxID=1094350 RepID=A0A9P4YUR9_9HYPO|nr:PITH domain [Geosmithia morbida]KAF4122425.1 PITH domain [Geosmithia morbida]
MSTINITSKEHFDNLIRSSKVVVADFYAEWCGPCKQIAPLYETLAKSLSRPGAVTFVKVDTDKQTSIAKEYSVAALPTFLVFRNGKVDQKVQGANPVQLKKVVEKLAADVQALEDGSSGSGGWTGADLPKGYSDITDQIEIRGCELLNADDDAGPVRVLFDGAKPTALSKDGKASSSEKDWVQSGADDQLLLFIPFQSTIKLHTLQITSVPTEGGDDAPARPGVIHLYINRTQNMDFNEADETDPTQAIEIGPDDWNANGTASIPLRFVKFQKTTTLVIYVQRGDGEAETVRLDRVRLIGDAGQKREMGTLKKVGDDE